MKTPKEVKVTLSADVAKALAEGRPVILRLCALAEFSVDPAVKAGKLKVAAAESTYKTVKQKVKAAPRQINFGHLRIIDAWNGHPYMEKLENMDQNRKRNKLAPTTGCPNDLLILIDTAIGISTPQKVIDSIDCYFAKCSIGANIGKKNNIPTDFSFASLNTFLSAFIARRKSYMFGWWEKDENTRVQAPPVEDKHPEQTKAVADAFAEEFLDRPAYDLKNPSKEYWTFLSVAGRIRSSLKGAHQMWSFEKLLKLVLKCVAEEHRDGSLVYPGTLINDRLWKISLPQYLSSTNVRLSLPSLGAIEKKIPEEETPIGG